MKLLTHDHRNAAKIIPEDLQKEVKAAISSVGSIKKATPTRDALLNTLRNKNGWSDEVRIAADAKISITSKKGDVGLCVQTGNMSRFYADLLKLEFLFDKGLIQAAVYIIADKELSKVWGENIAHYERFTKELKIFSTTIHVPILVIGIKASS